ncbi:MAG TPA: hypothetical protein VHQ24_03260, partial [Lachnospiraceae bacterium]|nr:hypothetical protein [Lachnospiraceae bacterium]
LDLSRFQDWTKDNAKIFIQVYGDNINELYEVSSSTSNQLYAFTFTQNQSGAKLVRFWRGQAVNYVWNSSIDLTYDDFVSGTNCVSVSGWTDQGSLITR